MKIQFVKTVPEISHRIQSWPLNRNVLVLHKCGYFTAEIFKRHLTQIPNFTFLQGPITNLWVSEDFLRFLWKYVIKISSSCQGRWNWECQWGNWPLQLWPRYNKTFFLYKWPSKNTLAPKLLDPPSVPSMLNTQFRIGMCAFHVEV